MAVIRYVGTPGRAKNLTAVEAADMLAHGVAVALVYEDRAGTALEGHARGEADARAALLDAHSCGVTVRCIYMAVDVDVTSGEELAAVDAYLAGAASVLGRDRVGVYGEFAVIEHCLSTGSAAYGWQTVAWSHSSVSTDAHLVQQLGQVSVSGVTCDVSQIKQQDFGQWPAPALVTHHQEDEDMVIVTAPNRPWLAYYEASGTVRVIGPGEPGPLRTLHQAAGRSAGQVTLSEAEYDQVVEFADRGVRGAVPGLATISQQVSAVATALTDGPAA